MICPGWNVDGKRKFGCDMSGWNGAGENSRCDMPDRMLAKEEFSDAGGTSGCNGAGGIFRCDVS